MDRPPFRGRLPVFIGDDVTDEDGIAAAAAMGGVGLRVQDAFGDAAGVRAWLQRIAANRDLAVGGLFQHTGSDGFRCRSTHPTESSLQVRSMG